MKEMLGGCCVCSDESGWAENPLVYCDGQGCTVAVHQACYGIVTVPTGPWYCRKCESTERSARVRCELCPSRDGALKRTEQEGWAHVVCALYIPEVRFRNVTTMEPILLDLIPSERFGKTCYICEEQGREARATVGACMQCNKAGCRQQFHVTCAQALGLLCEEAGNFLDNVKYCGYCQHHYSKLKKSNNVKTIPPYKPIPADSGSSDSSAEKESEAPTKAAGNSGKRRSSNSKAGASASKNKSNPSPNFEVNGALDERSTGSNTPKDNVPAKFTTSNFVETIVTQSESVFGTDVKPATITKAPSGPKSTASAPSNKSNHSGKKRKAGARTPTVPGNDNSNQSASSEASGPTPAPPTGDSGDVQTNLLESQNSLNILDQDKSRKPKAEVGLATQIRTSTVETGSTPVIMSTSQSQPMVAQSTSSTANSIVVSVPLTATSLPSNVQNITTPALYQQLQQCSINASAVDVKPPHPNKFQDDSASKRARSQATAEKQERTQKRKRGVSGSQTATTTTTTTTSTTTSSTVVGPVVTSITSSPTSGAGAVVITTKRSSRSNRHSPPPSNATVAPVSAIIQGPTLSTGHFSSVGAGSAGPGIMGPTVKDSPPSSPGSESMPNSGPGRRKRKTIAAPAQLPPTGAIPASTTPNRSASNTPTAIANNNHIKEEKDVKLFQNGVGAPHMLGNQLNPSSTMAQKMSDTLSQELEAHSIFTEASNSSTNLVGPQLHSRVIASVKSSQPFNHSASFANVFSGNSFSNMSNSSVSGLNSGAIPQTLEQLLERQWEQGSQFLMDQAQHFDIASLLSCLHQLKAENVTLEERVNTLVQRRDHLLAVNARLAIPLTSTSSTHQVNNMHPNVNPSSHPNITHADVQQSATMSRVSRDSRVNNSYLAHPSSSAHTAMENGLSPDPSPPASAASMQYQHRGTLIATQQNATIRHSPASGAYHQGQSSNIISPAGANNSGVVRNSSATPDPLRGVQR